MKCIALFTLILLAGCVSVPQKATHNMPIVNHCSGQALAILALTKPWAVHDCVEPEGLK